MSEKKDYKLLRENVATPRDRIDRIENLMVVGMPDINFCSLGEECWIELKSPVEPVRPTTKLFGSNHKLSQDQKNWFLRQKNAGGSCYILIFSDKRILLIEGEHADNLNDMTVAELIAVSCFHEIKPIKDKTKWSKLRSILQGN